jgi:hypothetical protein
MSWQSLLEAQRVKRHRTSRQELGGETSLNANYTHNPHRALARHISIGLHRVWRTLYVRGRVFLAPLPSWFSRFLRGINAFDLWQCDCSNIKHGGVIACDIVQKCSPSDSHHCTP